MNRLSFLHAIAERPDDDEPRLIYCDWLEEFGTDQSDHDRAEYIRLACELELVVPELPVLVADEARLYPQSDVGATYCAYAQGRGVATPGQAVEVTYNGRQYRTLIVDEVDSIQPRFGLKQSMWTAGISGTARGTLETRPTIPADVYAAKAKRMKELEPKQVEYVCFREVGLVFPPRNRTIKPTWTRGFWSAIESEGRIPFLAAIIDRQPVSQLRWDSWVCTLALIDTGYKITFARRQSPDHICVTAYQSTRADVSEFIICQSGPMASRLHQIT